jgi:hypothetical protein
MGLTFVTFVDISAHLRNLRILFLSKSSFASAPQTDGQPLTFRSLRSRRFILLDALIGLSLQ